MIDHEEGGSDLNIGSPVQPGEKIDIEDQKKIEDLLGDDSDESGDEESAGEDEDYLNNLETK